MKSVSDIRVRLRQAINNEEINRRDTGSKFPAYWIAWQDALYWVLEEEPPNGFKGEIHKE